MAIVCPQCNAENPDGFAFCGSCGGKLQREDPRAAKHHLAVLMCDLVDSTPISERLDPEDYLELIQAYQRRVHRIVSDWGGYAAQYLGDGVLIYFGYPNAAEDDTRRALSAGLAIVRATKRLSAVYLRDHGVELGVRVGIHTGPVVAADIGHEGRSDRLALGTTPNIAARVQGQAHSGQVVLSAAAYHALRGTVAAESLGRHELRGVSDSIELFLADTDKHVGRRAHQSHIIGRSGELERIRAALKDPSVKTICIEGGAGMGKSRLVEEISQETTTPWYTARCSTYHESVELHPVIELFKQLADVREDDSLSQRDTALRRWLEDLALTGEDVEFVARLVSKEGDFQARDHRETLRVIATCLEAIAAEISTVILIEDLHWADPSTFELLAQLTPENYKVVLTTRPIEAPTNVDVSIALPRLEENEIFELVAKLGGGTFSDDVVGAIVERCEGVPFYAEELARVVLETSKGEASISVVPDSVQSALHARLDALADAKPVAQVAALIGRRFDFDLLNACLHIELDVSNLLAKLISAQIVVREAHDDLTGFKFQHALVQDIAAESMLKSERKKLHQQIAQTIVSEFPERAERDPQMLARHFEGAEHYVEALANYRRAAETSRRLAAYEEAATNYRLALEMLDRADGIEDRAQQESHLLRVLVSALTARGGYQSDDTRPYLDRISALNNEIEDPIGRYGAIMSEWGYHAMCGHKAETFHFTELLKPYCQDPHPPLIVANACYAVGSSYFYGGEHGQAHLLLSDCLAVLEEVEFGQSRKDLEQPAFLAYLTRGMQACLMGDFGFALSLLDRSVAMACELGSNFGEVQALIHRGFLLREMERDPSERILELNRAVELSEEIGLDQWGLAARRMAEWARLEQGELDLLDVCLQHYEPESENTTVTLGYEIAHGAEVLIRSEMFDAARLIICRAREFVDHSLGRFGFPDVQRIEAILAVQDAGTQKAERLFSDALQYTQKQGLRVQELRLHMALLQYLPEAAQITRMTELLKGFTDGSDEKLLRRAHDLASATT